MAALRSLDDEVMEAPFDMGQFKRLLTYLKPYKKSIAIALVLMVISTLIIFWIFKSRKMF